MSAGADGRLAVLGRREVRRPLRRSSRALMQTSRQPEAGSSSRSLRAAEPVGEHRLGHAPAARAEPLGKPKILQRPHRPRDPR